jgi:hypothetical protein
MERNGNACDGNTDLKTADCPLNGKPCARVSRHTVLHQVRKPWARRLSAHDYYFCSDPDCDVVYFSHEITLGRSELRQSVGQKSREDRRTICYCFDITLRDICSSRESDKVDSCREYVIEKTRQSECNCETRNPSGRCCLLEFPRRRE